MQAEITYNWDDIEVGRFDLNHSENFFTQKHLNHEKFSEEFKLLQAMDETDLKEVFSEIALESCDNKENTNVIANQLKKQTISFPLSETKDQVKLEIEENQVQVTTSTSLTTSQSNRRPANLLTHSEALQTQVSKAGAASVAGKHGGKGPTKMDPPSVYDFKDIYQKKREEKLKKLLQEEKKNRVFHSRPVPKSVAIPRDPLARSVPSDFKFTIPKTPIVLKNSRKAEEKRMQRIEELKRKNPPIRFTSREAAVLQEEPFKPKKSGQIVQPQPFNLHVERRIEERKQYDEQHRRSAEEKKKQEEEARKKREEEMIKEIRKQTTFKARPNPFK